MPPTRQAKPPTPTRESVWFVVVLVAPINGTAITYDNIGNPNKTLNAAGQWVNLQWSGRQLVKATMPNGTYETYTYDADGLRTSRKQYNSGNTLTRSFTYTWIDGVMVGYQWHTPNNGKTESVKYLFDGGEAIGFVFHNNDPSGFTNPRYFTKNLQGDIVSIYHHDYSHRVTYSYDAWGNPSVVSGVDGSQYAWLLGYRGYQYDKETGLYYVASRYYNPKIGRWLNADTTEVLGLSEEPLENNQFAYCHNDAINLTDRNGCSPKTLFDSMDRAAIDFAKEYNPISIKENREYASYIYTKKTKEKMKLYVDDSRKRKTVNITTIRYSYVKPARGAEASAIPPKNWFGLKNRVAIVHTHAAYDSKYENDEFSPADMNYAKKLNVPIYVATPNGKLLKYNPSTRMITTISKAIPFDKNHPDKKKK